MKRIFISISLLLLTGYVFSQARDGTAEYQSTLVQQPAAMIDLPYAPDVVKAALKHYVSEITQSTKDGVANYQLSSNTLLARNNINNADMRFQIAGTSNGNPNESVVYLLLASTYQSISMMGVVSDRKNHFDMEEAKAYLDNLAVAIGPYAAEMQLKLQQKELSKAEAKDKKLLNKGVSLAKQNDNMRSRLNTNEITWKSDGLQRRVTHIEHTLLINKQEQVKQTADVAKQRAALVLLTN